MKRASVFFFSVLLASIHISDFLAHQLALNALLSGESSSALAYKLGNGQGHLVRLAIIVV